MTLEDYIQQLYAAPDQTALSALLIEFLKQEYDAAAISGQELPYGASVRDLDWNPIVSTFPKSAKEAYAKYRNDGDLFFEAAMANGAPVHYLHIHENFLWTEPQRALFKAMEDAGLKDGVSTPVFAKPGVAAYFVIAFPERRPDLTPFDLRRIHLIFSEYYFRYRDIAFLEKAVLSARERQILVGIIAGKSNTEIADQLNISRGTVDTYVRRSFEKLGVRSRVEAALRYFGLGLHLG